MISSLPVGMCRRRTARMRVMQRLCRRLCAALNLEVEFHAARSSRRSALIARGDARGTLFVANHISYLDVCIIGSFFPAVFVTSKEVEDTPVLGLFSKLGGCLFVERRRRLSVRADVNRIAALLEEGVNVVLFPEGSTSDGGEFLAFKKSLLESAIRSRSRVVALCVKYRAIAGRPFDKKNADRVAWYGDMTFFPHFSALLGISRIEASLSVLGELPFRGHKCRKQLAAAAKERIARAYFHG